MITYTRNPIALSVPLVGTIYCLVLAIFCGLPFPQLTSQCRVAPAVVCTSGRVPSTLCTQEATVHRAACLLSHSEKCQVDGQV